MMNPYYALVLVCIAGIGIVNQAIFSRYDPAWCGLAAVLSLSVQQLVDAVLANSDIRRKFDQPAGMLISGLAAVVTVVTLLLALDWLGLWIGGRV